MKTFIEIASENVIYKENLIKSGMTTVEATRRAKKEFFATMIANGFTHAKEKTNITKMF